MMTCTVLNCGAKHYGLGLCKLHYNRARSGKGLSTPACAMCGETTPRPDAKFCGRKCQHRWHRRYGGYTDARTLATRGRCSVCEKPVHANGLCRAHNKKLWKYGDTASRSPTLQPCRVCRIIVSVQNGKQPCCPRHYHKRYYHLNAVVERARHNARRTRMVVATPPWANHRAIHQFYIACPPGLHVDHVIPLKGKRVSGLHTVENLQYLEPKPNRQKLNSFTV